jgi:hypothetical protein
MRLCITKAIERRFILIFILVGLFKVVGLERGALSLVSTTEELLDRKIAAPV